MRVARPTTQLTRGRQGQQVVSRGDSGRAARAAARVEGSGGNDDLSFRRASASVSTMCSQLGNGLVDDERSRSVGV